MSTFVGPMIAAPRGSTGNNTHASVRLHPAAERTGIALVVENGGATPAISWKVQGSLDRDGVADGSANWVDLACVSAASDNPAAIPVVVNPATTGVSSVLWLGGGGPAANKAPPRPVRRLRVVTSANTNVTYRVELSQQSRELAPVRRSAESGRSASRGARRSVSAAGPAERHWAGRGLAPVSPVGHPTAQRRVPRPAHGQIYDTLLGDEDWLCAPRTLTQR